MMTAGEKSTALKEAKRGLLEAYREAERMATAMEEALVDDAALAKDEDYGMVCRLLGGLEEIITAINNRLNKLI